MIFINEGIEMNVAVFYYLHNIVVSTDVLINRAKHLSQSAYIESHINVITYNLHHFLEVPIDNSFIRSFFCVNVMRNKYSSWYAEHMHEKWNNGILIRSCIVTLQYHPSYVWKDHIYTFQYIFNEQ